MDTDVPLRHVEIPFGPFICAACLVYLFLQEPLLVAVRDFYGVG